MNVRLPSFSMKMWLTCLRKKMCAKKPPPPPTIWGMGLAFHLPRPQTPCHPSCQTVTYKDLWEGVSNPFRSIPQLMIQQLFLRNSQGTNNTRRRLQKTLASALAAATCSFLCEITHLVTLQLSKAEGVGRGDWRREISNRRGLATCKERHRSCT